MFRYPSRLLTYSLSLLFAFALGCSAEPGGDENRSAKAAVVGEPSPDEIYTCPGDDPAEPNDSRAAAVPIAEGSGWVSAVACSHDGDWFSVTAESGCRVEATLLFSHAEGDLNAQLHMDSGQLAGAYSATDDEFLSAEVPASGQVYLYVWGQGGASASYFVSMDVICRSDEPPAEEPVEEEQPIKEPLPEAEVPTEEVYTCPADDIYEANDRRSHAYLLPAERSISLAAVACANDGDWYRVELEAGCSIEAAVLFSHAEGDLHAQLHAKSRQIAGAYSSDDNEFLSATATATGPHYVYVWGNRGASAAYRLDIDIVCPGDDRVIEEPVVEEPAPEEPVVEEPVVEEPAPEEPVVEEPVVEEPAPEEPVVEEPVVEEPVVEEPVVEEPVDEVLTCPADDSSEPNDDQSAAALISSGTLSAIACPNDGDWYAFDALAGCVIDAAVLFAHADGNLHAQLHGASGQLAGAYSTDDNEYLQATASADGRFYIFVWGHSGATAPYDLQLDIVCADGSGGDAGSEPPVEEPPVEEPPVEEPPAGAGDGIRSDTVDGWTLEVLAADHIRVGKVEGGSLVGRLSPADIQVTSTLAGGIGVEAVGYRDYPVARDWSVWPHPQFLRHEAYARLARPLEQGETVDIRVALPSGALIFTVTFDAYVTSPYVKVNQVGFLPEDGHKTAYVGGFLGSLGPLPVAPTSFEILTVASGEVVHTGWSESTVVDSPESGERVLRLPFGALTTPGHYVVRVPGHGLSVPFFVDADVYVDAYRDGLRSFYHHRCGCEIHAAHSDFPRPACHHEHELEGVIHEMMPTTELYAGEPVGSSLGMVGGWHDASDFGKYVPTAAAALYEMFRIVDLAPDLLLDGFSDIPESGNGVPDIIDELVWELDWFVQMMRPDGGTYHKLTGRAWNTDRMPHEDLQVRTLSDVTTNDTGRMAAVMAMASRHVAPWFPERAEQYRAAALQAWSFLEAHPTAQPSVYTDDDWNGGGPYVDRFGDEDERAWAAVELYRLTGESRFHDAFLAILPDDLVPHAPPAKVSSWPPLWEDSWRWAMWSYSQLPAELSRDESVVEVIREAWRMRADELTRVSEQTAYGLSMVPAGAYGYGAANGHEGARDLLLALVQVGRDDAAVRAALRNMAFLLGANGQRLSYMTGVGTDYARDTEYSVDYNDGIAEPLPGHVIDGPSNAVFWANNGFESELYPAGMDYPRAQRYFDFPDPIMNEPVIDEMASSLIPFALLSSDDFRQRWL